MLAPSNSQVGFVEEEHELGLLEVADLGQRRVEAREHPHHEGREEGRLVLHVGELEHGDEAASVALDLEQIVEVELGLAEESQRALLLELHELAQQHAHRRLRHSAVAGELARAVAREVHEDGAQIREVEQLEIAVVAPLEDHREHAGLRLVQAEHPGEQQRAERRHRGPELGAQFSGEAQELDGAGGGAPREARFPGARVHALVRFAGDGEAREIALQVRQEDRNAGRAQLLRHQLKRLGLARARRPGDQAMAVQHRERDRDERLGVTLAPV